MKEAAEALDSGEIRMFDGSWKTDELLENLRRRII